VLKNILAIQPKWRKSMPDRKLTLGAQGFQNCYGDLGPAKPAMATVTHNNLFVTFTERGVLISVDNPFLLKWLQHAAEAVGNTTVRIRSRS
jgi:hypothetical protein